MLRSVTPARAAMGLLFASAGLLLAGIAAFCLAKEASLGSLIFAGFTTAWFCVPLVLAATSVDDSQPVWRGWTLVIFEGLLVSADALLIPPLFLQPDAQGGIAIGLLTIVQVLALGVLVLLIKLIAAVMRTLR